jgi:hypothetical protein
MAAVSTDALLSSGVTGCGKPSGWHTGTCMADDTATAKSRAAADATKRVSAAANELQFVRTLTAQQLEGLASGSGPSDGPSGGQASNSSGNPSRGSDERARKSGKPVVLQTAIVSYKATSGPYVAAQVDLIGAIHIADKAYFQQLNQRFKTYDAVLYEMVADPEMVRQVAKDAKNRSSVSAIQSGMKDMLGLSFQLDEIDYKAKNFVHADMNPDEFNQSLTQRQDGMLQFVMRSMGASMAAQGAGKTNDLEMLGALFSSNRELALKRVLSQQMEQMDGQLAALAGDDGKSTLITERNAKALEVLKRELDSGKKRLGIFYGAGHFRHMSAELASQFQLQPIKTEWLEAWDMR